MRRLGSLTLALAAALAAPALAQDGSQARAAGELRWKLAQGDALRYGFTWILEQKRDLGGMNEQQTFEVGYTLDQKVTAVDGQGLATIEATLAVVRGRLGLGMMGDMSYDSVADASNTDNPLAWLRHLVGKTFTYTMTPRGEVTTLTGGDAIRTEVMDAIKKEAAAKPKPQGGGEDPMGMMMDPAQLATILASRLVVVFADTSLKSSLEVTNDLLPDAAKKENDTWTRPIVETLPRIGTMRYTAHYTHRGGTAEATRLTSRVEGEIALERDQGGAGGGNPGDMSDMMEMAEQMMAKRLEVKRKAATGTATFSAAKGRLLDSEVVQEIVMEGPLPPEMAMMMGEQAKDMKLNQAITLTLRYVQEDAAAAPATPKPADKPGGNRSF